MSFVRKIKKGKSTYLAKVENYRKDGKVKQRVIEYIGKEENGYIKLTPELQKIFKTSEDVNNALKAVIAAIPKARKRATLTV
jgi:hypothetical protein